MFQPPNWWQHYTKELKPSFPWILINLEILEVIFSMQLLLSVPALWSALNVFSLTSYRSNFFVFVFLSGSLCIALNGDILFGRPFFKVVFFFWKLTEFRWTLIFGLWVHISRYVFFLQWSSILQINRPGLTWKAAWSNYNAFLDGWHSSN